MPTVASPSCPRCGYDQSGAIASWNHTESLSCPLTGTCSECGLEFHWYDVLFAERLRMPGFYEHGTGLAFASAWRTLVWTLWPPTFWSRVKLEHPVRWRRALLWLIVLLVPFQAAHIMFDAWSQMRIQAAAAAAASATPIPGLSGTVTFIQPPWQAGVIGRWLTPVLSTMDLRYQFVRQGPSGASALPAADPFFGVRSGWHEWPYFAMPTLWFSFSLPIMLMLLPQTRKLAKIQRSHVFRAWAYSMSWVAVLALLRFADQAWAVGITTFSKPPPSGIYGAGWPWSNPYREPVILPFLAEHSFLTALVISVWLAWWWRTTVGRGFRVDRPTIVLIAMLVPALLVMTISASIVSMQFGLMIDQLTSGKFRWP